MSAPKIGRDNPGRLFALNQLLPTGALSYCSNSIWLFAIFLLNFRWFRLFEEVNRDGNVVVTPRLRLYERDLRGQL